MPPLVTPPRDSWPWRVTVAAGCTVAAVVLTHVFWRYLGATPFLMGFGAAVLSARLAGRYAGALAIGLCAAGYSAFPPPLPAERMTPLLAGFVLIAGMGSWLVARRREIEVALRLSEARLTQAQTVAQIGNWEWEVASNALWWSDELYRIFGVERATFDNSFAAFIALVHPEDRPIVERAVRGALQERQPYEIEHRIVRPNGDIRVLHGQGRVVTDDGGRVVRIMGVAQDITARKAAEEVVSRSEQRLQTIIDAEPACVKLVSPEGVVLEMNRAGLEMVGATTLDQVVGQPVIGLVHPDDRSRYLAAHAAASSGVRQRWEFRIVGVTGEERWVDSNDVPFVTSAATGDAPAVLSVTSDVTERKQLEDQLRQSQKMEAIGLLAGGIAHDFNNLLTAIGGYTEQVLETLDAGDPRREDLLEVAKASQRAAALTRQLLAVSRRQFLEPSVLDLNAMVGDVHKLLRRTIPENIDLQVALSPALDQVRADRGQIEQVVLNLVINAGDAMPQGGELRVATANADVDEAWARRHPPMPPGRYVRLSVSDTGSGMPPETQARMFEPFFTTKARGKGTGLGLATVYGIVKQSEGFIWVTSEVGQGTTIEVYLPVVGATASAAVHAPAATEVRGGSQTILLAEDDAAVRRLARETLKAHGYTVLDAADGDEALTLARQYTGTIDLLLTDVVMPRLGGRELAERLGPDRPGMRVLYTSGYTENVMVRAGFEQGLTLLTKPFLPADLLRKVRESLAGVTP